MSNAINRYDEFGIPASTNLGRIQYTGQMWLTELGMYNYKARIYSPTLGRFMQTDPIGYGDGLNWYNYVGGDPVNKTDPTGLADDIVVSGTRPISGAAYGLYGIGSQRRFAFTTDFGEIFSSAIAAALGVGEQITKDYGEEEVEEPQSGPKPCPAVPSGGPGRDQLNRNVAEARRIGRTFTPGSGPSSAFVSGRWFSNKVKSGGAWDYKNQGYSKGQDFGNFNYGATSEALGFDGGVSDFFADLYSLWDHGTLEGEDAMIRAGQRYARMGCDK